MLLRQWVRIAKVIHSGEHPGRCSVGEGAGALTSFSQGPGHMACVGSYPHLPLVQSVFVGHHWPTAPQLQAEAALLGI